MVMPYHLRKPRRSKQECQFLTKKAHELILAGKGIDEALAEVGITTAVYYRNCKKMRLKTKMFLNKVNVLQEKEKVFENINKSEPNYKELLKEFLLDKFMNEKGLK